MEELSAVENYIHLEPANDEEAQRKQWAGDKGFTVTIGKPYYWEAGTAKEKEFFIGSMVKIYNKYTKGDFPVLTGFSATELGTLTNGQPHLATLEGRAASRGQGAPSPGQQRSSPPDQRQMPPKSPGAPLRKPGEASSPLAGENRRGPPLGVNPNFRRPPGEANIPRRPARPDDDLRPGSRPSTGDEARRPPPFPPNSMSAAPSMPNLRQKQPMDPSIRSRPSGETMRMRGGTQAPSPLPTQQFAARNLTPQSSSPELAGRPRTPDSGNYPSSLSPARGPSRGDAQSQRSERSMDNSSFDGAAPGIAPPDQRRQNGYPSPRRDPRDPSPRGLRPGTAQSGARPGTAQSNASSSFPRNEDAPPDEPPQRKRPVMEARPSQMSQRSVDSQGTDPRSNFQTPSASPAPPAEVPPRRRPEIPERLKPTSQENVSYAASQPTPPPTSPLPQIPTAPITQAAPTPMQQAPTLPAPVQETPGPQAPIQQESVPQAPIQQASVPVEAAPPAVQPSSTTPDSAGISTPTEEKDEDASHRPGLGPMVKKPVVTTEAATKFRKFAAAAGAFKPRAGGAAAKLLNKETKKSDEPDGVNAVFVPQRQAPKETPKEEVEQKLEEPPKPTPDKSTKERPHINTELVPSVTVSGPLTPTQPSTIQEVKEQSAPPTPEKIATKEVTPEPEVRRKKRRSNQQIVNISKLGIDPSIIDERGLEFESILSELGWGSNELSNKHIESLETDIKREIARVEAGSWLNHLEQKDDRVEAVERMLDRAIAECDELEGLLTLYNVELSSLNDDIAFIEAQSQGLQVQTANQRLLQHELQQLVDTISITSDQLEPLRRAPIGKINGLKDIEFSLVLLYKALITIDPSFVAGGRSGATAMDARSGFGNSDLAAMQALQEKRDRYLGEGAMFLDRLKKHMNITFGAAFMSTKDALSSLNQGSMPSLKDNIDAHDAGRNELWMLSPVMLFAKEIDRASWDMLLRMYQDQAAQLYQQEVRDNILAWRKFARKPTGEEQELLFTAQEKEPESITGTARKLTVKRSQTLARGLRSASGDKEAKTKPASQDGKLHAFDVFARILEDTGPVLLTEQNFITEFFHATSTDSLDFPDAVQAAAPEERRGPNLWIRKQFEADRAMAKHVSGVMEEIFSFWPAEIQSLVDWATKADPL